jgi:hypothetical protein
MLYLLLIILFTFSKELIVINAEFIVIVGFLTIFFILKSLLVKPIVENLEAYSQKIRDDYLLKINTGISTINLLLTSIEEKVQYTYDLEEYYIYLEDLLLDFLDAGKKHLNYRLGILTTQGFLQTFLKLQKKLSIIS